MSSKEMNGHLAVATSSSGNQALSFDVRTLLDRIRQESVSFSMSCGVRGGILVNIKPRIEDALILHMKIFHLKGRWKTMSFRTSVDEDRSVFAASGARDLDELINVVLNLDRPGTECRKMLDELRRSLMSFVKQCATHRFGAAAVE
jgi:hypothetical protein